MSKDKLPQVGIGILGGTGLYEMEGVRMLDEIRIDTPFGPPSDSYMLGELEDKKIAFLTRHGRGHRLLPSDINFRANIYGFKTLGVERIISVNSVGSLNEEIRPRDIVCADQFFDRTRRKSTFFGEGIAAHISFAEPVCPTLSSAMYKVGREARLRIHQEGTYLCMEGPAFSTKAESKIYRSWGCDVIGMTSATEARLSREAEICYATMNLVTDYDVWHESEEPVSVEMILENLRLNIDNAKTIIRKTVAALSAERGEECGCGRALENCIVTQTAQITEDTKEKLKAIIGKYV